MKNDMTKGTVLPIILRFMIPLMIGNMFQQVYNAVDSMIVGRFVGEEALAAVGSTGTIMFLVQGIACGLAAGFTVLVAQKFGEGDKEGTRTSVANGTILAAIVVVVMTVLSLSLMKQILTWMNTPDNIFQDAYCYIMIICCGIICSVGYNFFSSCIRATGNSTIPLVTLIFSAALNVVLDLLLIVNLKMGVAGAALATNIAQAVSTVLCIVYILKKEEWLRPKKEQFHLEKSYYTKQLQVGIPMAVQFGITASGTIVMQAAFNLFGSTVIAAYTAANRVHSIFTQGMIAMGQTMATYCGQNYGACQANRIRKGVASAVLIETIYACLGALLLYFGLPYYLHLFFSGDADLTMIYGYARQIVLRWVIFYIPLSYIFIFRNAMQGCGFALLPMLGGVVELVARLICAGIAMWTMNFTAAILCDPMAWFSAAIWTGVSYIFVIKRVKQILDKKENEFEN